MELVDARFETSESEYSRAILPRTSPCNGRHSSGVHDIFSRISTTFAQVVELVDTTVLEAVAVRCKSSSLFLGTIKKSKKLVRAFYFSQKLYTFPMDSLFSRSITPLASLLRPEKLDDLVGQKHLIALGKPIRKFIEAGRIPSLLFW